jgi:hypothetical protein
LRALGPQATLDRGYALVLDAAGHPVSRATKALEGKAVEIVLSEGAVGANLTDARPRRTLLEALGKKSSEVITPASPVKKRKPKK